MIATFLGLLRIPAVRYAVAGLGAVLLIPTVVSCIRDDAADDERARAAAEQARASAVQREREATAGEVLRASEAAARTLADQRRQEIDNETRNIPDQTISARQCARLRVELRRQGASERDVASACGPSHAP